ncbi:MAG TPA: hypothetical protein EYM38_05880 [Dehalococcoidia bacterium]|nr:hypothetical protein [Dehalococcoidia bacterium]
MRGTAQPVTSEFTLAQNGGEPVQYLARPKPAAVVLIVYMVGTTAANQRRPWRQYWKYYGKR